jgi:ribonuclease P protein subunit RPR2
MHQRTKALWIKNHYCCSISNDLNKEEMDLGSDVKQIARQRIAILFEQAQETCSQNPKLAQRQIFIARRIAMAARIRFPKPFKQQICKKCNLVFIQGENCRVRIQKRRQPHVVTTCLSCGHVTRTPINPRKVVVKK